MIGEQTRAPQWGIGLSVTGTFQVQTPSLRMARNGQAFLVFQIPLGGVPVPVFAWRNECEGPQRLAPGQPIHLVGHTEQYQGRKQVRAKRISPAEGDRAASWAKERLRVIYQWLEPPVLQELVEKVVLDEVVGRRFVSLPASQRHHHAYTGGLLEHSVEVAWQVFRQPSDNEVMHSLALVAALFHDIGKTKAYREEAGFTAAGEQVGHDALTLEVLAPALAFLDAEWPEGAGHLRSLLASEGRNSPSLTQSWKWKIQEADRNSAALCRPNEAGEG